MTDHRVPHVQRCTEQRLFGVGHYARYWQCRRSPAPHDGIPCDFGIDAEVFGRDLEKVRPEVLAGLLRDRVALERNTRRQLEALQATTIDILLGWATGRGVAAETVRWVQTNTPDIAAQLGWERVQ